MTEVGLLAGDPCVADEWTADQQARAYGWWLAVAKGAPSLRLATLRSFWDELVRAYGGLRTFLGGRR